MGGAGAGTGSGSLSASIRAGYRRRDPERALLHATVRTHLKTFLAEMEQRGDGAGLPGFVPPHAWNFDPPRGPRAPARAHAPVGPLFAVLGAFPPRPRPSAHHPHARPGAARDLHVTAPARAAIGSAGATDGGSDLRAAIRWRPQPQYPPPLRHPGRRFRPQGGQHPLRGATWTGG